VFVSSFTSSREDNMSELREKLDAYVQKVRRDHEACVNSEETTKQSIIAPLFVDVLGYDMSNPRECLAEYKVDFGSGKSREPIDWAFKVGGQFAFFVEAKRVDIELKLYTEQLGDYFAREPSVKLGILTNGVEWRFFTDADNSNIMDRKPFVTWDVLKNSAPPLEVLEVLTRLQKERFYPENFRTLAEGYLKKSQLIVGLNDLLAPSSEFTRLVLSALPTLESRNRTEAVLEEWKPKISEAMEVWARQKMSEVAGRGDKIDSQPEQPPKPPRRRPKPDVPTTSEGEPTEDKLRAFKIAKNLLGKDRPVVYTDRAAYFRIHTRGGGEGRLARRLEVCRLFTNGRYPVVYMPVPLSPAEVDTLGKICPRVWFPKPGCTAVKLNSIEHIKSLGDVLRITYDRQVSSGGDEVSEAVTDGGGDPATLKIA
jgi:hypothetical protein